MVTVTARDTPGHYGSLGRLERDAPSGTTGRPVSSDQPPATSDCPRPSNHDPPPSTLDHPLSEATLARLWVGQRFPASALVTRQRVPVRVLHPGRPGRAAGPDFRDAIITAPSGGLLRGDVELHVRASDFRAHGHHRDRRYDDVVLHVVFEDDSGGDTRLASGRHVPVVALAPWVRRRARELAGWLATPQLWREPCHDAVARMGREEVLRTLEELGDGRFREREAALAAAVRTRGAGEALYQALLAGLGYGGDQRLLETVAERLPWRELVARLAEAPGEGRVVLAEALLLDAAGQAPSRRSAQSRGAVSSLRPANHPERRLAGLARLVVRHRPLLEGGRALEETLEGPALRLIEDWTVPADGHWRRGPAGALIGRGRAIELLVNAVLPWAAARAEDRGDAEAAARARACFERLPRPGRYGVLAFLEANLRSGDGPLALNARRQQGLLALCKTECRQGGCGRCPLS